MDFAAMMREVDRWTIEERLTFVETMWDHLLDSGLAPGMTEAQRAELDRRIEDMDQDPDGEVSYDAIRSKFGSA
jgi:putative addiction module component (TIGR02574 family)